MPILDKPIFLMFYETTFITRPDISNNDVENLTSGFCKILEDGGAKIIKKEYWGLRNLAYSIKNSNKGHYTYLCYESDADTLNEVERKMRLNEDVIKHLSIKLSEADDKPTMIMSQAGSENK